MVDYIDREKIFSIWRSMPAPASVTSLAAAISQTPAADVAEVRHGRWLPVMESEITGFNPEFAGCDPVGGYVCSECKTDAELDCNDQFVLSNYCPSCGALMDKEDEHEVS